MADSPDPVNPTPAASPATPPPEPSLSSVEGLRRLLRRSLVLIAGTLVVLLGVAMLPLPGPGAPIIFAGIAILAAEFAWAAVLLRRIRKAARDGLRMADDLGARKPRRRVTTFLMRLWHARKTKRR